MPTKIENRNYAIDFLKFIAFLFITNSHFTPLYKDVNTAFATLGVHGNALFFFISGFTLALNKNKTHNNFLHWYKCRLSRIWPTLIMLAILTNIMYNKAITWNNIILASEYWFLQCILYSYIFIYFLLGKKNSIILWGGFLSIFLTIITVLYCDKSTESIFHYFHWICYISCMILGIYCAKNKHIIKYGGTKTIISFILYFIIMSIGKGKNNNLYYTQLFAIIPLHLFLFYFYYWSSTWISLIYSKKSLYNPIYWIGSLCLEIYLVQYYFLTDKFNSLFPLNIIIVFGEILIAAYLLRISTNFFLQTLNKLPYNWKNIFNL